MERNAFFDNAKLALIFLVVFGHMIQPFTNGSNDINTLYTWIYTFHMPAFIFLSGFFAKGSGNKAYVLKLAKKLILPYLIFQLLYTAFYFFIGKDDWQSGVFYPQWSLWFLFSLFSWHMLLYWFKKIPPVLSIAIAVEIGLIVGYFGEVGHTFSLSRTFVFFPFFLIGYWLKEEHVMLLKTKAAKIISVIVMLSVAGAIYLAPEINSGWLLASKSYGDLGMPEFGGLARLIVYVTSALMAMSVLAWIPKSKHKLTILGTRTLYVYLLHGFFIQFFRETDLFAINNIIDLFGLAVISAAIVLVLSSKPIKVVWQPFIEGKISNIRGFFGQTNRRTQHNQNLNT
ncbi:acyltransferase family protein [Virgibacillus dakarensis]|uniref:Acyltransferase n=1 Tax=Lentibacillus populi TaxID=1827502 RepID=A0A9W5TVW5_9BACI|nr:acyltransferase family protein [Lentibacillus populi]MTW86107.1 acyltransferase family protein [Virgibacillus dakarensis]GGB35081.1 acyltransferase [Lentibacillus populi]